MISFLKKFLAKLGALVRRQAHRFQAALYVAGSVVWQVAAGAGIDAALHWTAKEWALRLLYTAGPPILFLIRGPHAPLTKEEILAMLQPAQGVSNPVAPEVKP